MYIYALRGPASLLTDVRMYIHRLTRVLIWRGRTLSALLAFLASITSPVKKNWQEARAQIPSPWPLGGDQDPLCPIRRHHGRREKSSDPKVCWAISPTRAPNTCSDLACELGSQSLPHRVRRIKWHHGWMARAWPSVSKCREIKKPQKTKNKTNITKHNDRVAESCT